VKLRETPLPYVPSKAASEFDSESSEFTEVASESPFYLDFVLEPSTIKTKPS
jgi:hypothetical protein